MPNCYAALRAHNFGDDQEIEAYLQARTCKDMYFQSGAGGVAPLQWGSSNTYQTKYVQSL